MTEPITINVTQDHIDKGKPNCSGTCPISLAMVDAGYGPLVHTNVRSVLWSEFEPDDGTPTDYFSRLPLHAQAFVIAFDARGDEPWHPAHTAPFTFTLAPEETK